MDLKINRRNMLAVTASGVAIAGCGKADVSTKSAQKTPMQKTPSQKTPVQKASKPDLTAQMRMLKSGELKASELLEATITRIETLNPKTGAVITTCYDRARDFVAKLPAGTVAGGAPMLIKDLKDVKGVRSTYGIGALKNFIAPASDIYTKRVEAAGMAIVGKTNTPELGLLPVTEPLAYKPAKNPWDLTRTPGGSSGGTAAAVASGMLPCAQGSDGGGSIRIPAHYCGLFGLKPSRGRVVSKNKKDDFSISVYGALSRTVRDSALMMSITETADKDRNFGAIGLVTDPIDRPLKIGFAMDDYFMGKNICDGEVTTALEQSAKLCESLGHHVEVVKPPVFGQEIIDAFLMLWASGPYATLSMVEKMKGGKVTDQDLEPWTQGLAQMFADNGGQEGLGKALAKLRKAERDTVKFLSKYDVVLSPVMPTAAHKLGKYDTSDISKVTEGFDIAARSVGYTAVQNVSGAPCMSVPLFRSPSNLPIGSQFITVPGKDDLLLQLAYQLEAAAPWIDSYPDLT